MNNQGNTGKENTGKTRRKPASPNKERNSRRHSFNRAVRIDWDKVSFAQEEWEQENIVSRDEMGRVHGLESLSFSSAQPGPGKAQPPRRKKSARPASRTRYQPPVEFIQNELEGDDEYGEIPDAPMHLMYDDIPETDNTEIPDASRMRFDLEDSLLDDEEEIQEDLPAKKDPSRESASADSVTEPVKADAADGESHTDDAVPSGKEDKILQEPAEASANLGKDRTGAAAPASETPESSQPEKKVSGGLTEEAVAREPEVRQEAKTPVREPEKAPETKASSQEPESVPAEEAAAQETEKTPETAAASQEPAETSAAQETVQEAEETPSATAAAGEQPQTDASQTAREEAGIPAKENAAQSLAETAEETEGKEAAASPETTGAGPAPAGPVRRRKSARPQHISYTYLNREQSPEIYPDPEPEEEVPVYDSGARRSRLLRIAAGMVATILIAAYAGVSYYYVDHFFNRTSINGIDCSGLTAYETEQLFADSLKDYSIQVSSRNHEVQEIKGSEIGYRYFSDGEILSFLKKQKPYAWITGLFLGRNYTMSENSTFDKTLLQTQLKELNCAREENQVAPQDAYVTMVNNEFSIIPETEGSELIVKEAYKVLDQAVSTGQPSVDFTSEPAVYAEAEIKKDSPTLQSMLDAYNNYARANITYKFGNETVRLDGDTIKTWLEFDDKGQLLTNSDMFKANIDSYVEELAAKYDTIGTTRSFTATDGRTVSVYSYAYGWMIDEELESAQLEQEVMSGATVTREPIWAMTANAYGSNDLGDTYIEVDMSEQHMYYYQNGAMIFDSDFVSGDVTVDGHATPEGIYTLYGKQSPAVLRGSIVESTGKPEYETEVTFWMPFNGGIGFHDAEWQPYFGGDRYIGGGSHGCINLPYDAAATLYDIIQYDVPIVCFY